MITGVNHVDTFLAKMAPTAQAVGRQWNIPASVIIAQAALETGWGQAVEGNAYFGIKQGNSTGESIAFTTHEIIEGQKVTQVDRFRAYRSLQDATKAYAQFLHDTPRYQKAFRDTSDPAAFIEALHQAGYATDPHYADKVKQIMQRYQLTGYDYIQPTTPPPETPEPSAQHANQRGSSWSGGVFSVLKYLTVPDSRQLPPPSLGTRQPDARAQTHPVPTPAAAAGQSGLASSHGLAPDPQRLPSDGPVPGVLPLTGQSFADFPRLLWEQVRQFMWSHSWSLPQLAKSPPGTPRRA